MNRTEVLFVDDDTNVLNGLRRMLYSQRDRWHMHYAVGGGEAIQLMQNNAFDVVISDMRMPVHDGVAVLKAAKEYSPAALRCVLSGQSDREQAYRVLETAHQFISKPCDVKALESVILKAQALKAKLPPNDVKVMVTSLSNLPVIEKNYSRFMEEIQKDRPSIDVLAESVASDIALTTKVLQLVASSFFGQPSKIACPKTATKLLGVELLTELAIHRKVFRPFRGEQLGTFSIEDLTEHSLDVARCAKAIALYETGDMQIAEAAYLAGMLHDVGKLVLADQAAEAYSSAVELSMAMNTTLWESETHVFGTSHAEIGSYLLALWGLPSSVIDAVSCYRQPSECNYDHFDAVTAVHVANLLRRRSYAVRLPEQDLLYASEHLVKTGLASHIPQWCETIRSVVNSDTTSSNSSHSSAHSAGAC
ncbi:MAG: response regulator [Pirellulales bacterium]